MHVYPARGSCQEYNLEILFLKLVKVMEMQHCFRYIRVAVKPSESQRVKKEEPLEST